MTLIIVIAATILLVLTTALNMLWTTLRLRRVDSHMSQALAMDVRAAPMSGLIGQLQSLGERLRPFYSPASIDHLRSMVQIAGFNPHRMLPVLLAAKLLVMLAIMAIGVLGAYIMEDFRLRLLFLGGGIIFGIMGPEWILKGVRHRFVSALDRGTPDALDLLVVCTEAGMALESALDRVAREMENANAAMATALSNLIDDLRVLPNRRDAFQNLGSRYGVEGLRRVGAVLSQSVQYGTPLGHALRAVADELRNERMNRLKEKAVKLPSKLIFPMIFFIMPSLYIVLLGPTFMRLYDSLMSFAGMTH